nr:MAG TPA: hypothetical protein [Bacteriophage sp.]DAO71096.1 MAG TPA: hypothetical protein [Caudoviricetes sp.]
MTQSSLRVIILHSTNLLKNMLRKVRLPDRLLLKLTLQRLQHLRLVLLHLKPSILRLILR